MLRVVTLITLLLTSRAHAQQPSAADKLFEEGRVLADQKRWSEACAKFQQSYELDPAIGTQLNLANCHEQLGHLRKAWELFEGTAAKAAEANDQREKYARERADGVAARLATIVVVLPRPAPPAITITIAGRTLTGATTRDRVEPGVIEVVASVPDLPPYSTRVTAAAGGTIEVEIPRFRPPRGPETPRSGRSKRIKLAFGVGGVGAASAIAATILTLKARGDYNDVAEGPDCSRVTGGITCNAAGDAAIADAQHLADIGTGFAVASVVLVGAGAIIYATAPRDNVRVAPVVTARGGGLAIGGSF